VVLDVSASMEESLDKAKKAALTFLEETIQPKDRAAVITFNDHPNLLVKFTNDVTTLAGGLAGLKAERGTALYDTVVFSLFYFSGLKGQRAMLLLSDGKDEGSRFSFEEAVDYARRAGVTIYAIGLGEDLEKKKLAKFADETGGRAFFLKTVDELPAIYKAIENELRSQYLIAYQSTNRALSARVVNKVISSFQVLNIQSAREKSTRRREFLEEQFARTDSLLTRAQAELATFRSRQQLASSESKLQAEQAAMLALQQKQAELSSDEKTFTTLLSKLKTGTDADRAEALRALASSPAIGDNPSVSQLFSQLNNYQFRLDSMTTGPWAAAPTNPDVVQLRTLIQSSQTNLVQALSSHLASIDARIGALNGLQTHSGQSIQLLPAMAEEEMRLTRRVDALARQSDDLRADYQRAKMAEEVEAGDIDVVDLAAVPYTPLWAAATNKLAIGFILGLFLGLGLAFLLEALNTSIRRPEDIESALHLPGLAVIPRLTPATPRRRLGGLLKGGKTQANTRAAAIGTAAQPFSIGTEAFRMLRTSLFWSDGSEQLKTLVITSAAPGDGKTLTAANLATSFAHDGLRVLLVDCDIRRPQLHGLFRAPRSPGLLDLLAPPARESGREVRSLSLADMSDQAGDPLAHVVRSTPFRGLSLLTCGTLPTNASNLLSGVRMRSFLALLKERYDLVVLDTPPVLATADAGILGSLTDGVLLVVRAGQTDRSAAQRATAQLASSGARVLGVVLNDPKGQVSQYGDYYYPYEYTAEPE
jgi:tyrosine-protein kinase Etk/Wzc